MMESQQNLYLKKRFLILGYKKVASLSHTHGLGHKEFCLLTFLLILLKLQGATGFSICVKSNLPPVSKAHEVIMGYRTFKNKFHSIL